MTHDLLYGLLYVVERVRTARKAPWQIYSCQKWTLIQYAVYSGMRPTCATILTHCIRVFVYVFVCRICVTLLYFRLSFGVFWTPPAQWMICWTMSMKTKDRELRLSENYTWTYIQILTKKWHLLGNSFIAFESSRYCFLLLSALAYPHKKTKVPRKALVLMIKPVFYSTEKCIVCSSLGRTFWCESSVSDSWNLLYIFLQNNCATTHGQMYMLGSVTGRIVITMSHISVTPNLLIN